ncbi:ABC transporter substrate-binding protein [Roseomonas sp. OT10]|uniref:ABC transporter substrate-binding protein n=1 Tax=Roseomonas cutis TaxID=2897332 RepID=UPI001E487146|nr:ABC transporter substrate-binding protein [Roseomonas sp. OT10]UFN48032.1 ABC transporter substrate-binding protein [Roseomonas sp. OT10]
MPTRRAVMYAAAGSLAAPLIPRPAAAATRELRYRLTEDPESLYSGQSVSLTVSTCLNFLHDRLVYIDEDGKAQPWLAESWSFSDDNKQITFKLRPGTKFHDGTDFDAAAVKFHFDNILDPKLASPVRGQIAALDSCDVLDPLTVRLSFSRPFAAAMILLASASYGFNSPAAVQKAGRQYGRRPVGTGPFMFKSWSAGSEIVLVRNPRYRQLRPDALNKGPAYAEQVTLSVLPEEGVAFSALQTGELSAAELQTDTVDRLRQDRRFSVVIDDKAKNILFMEFSFRPPFDDRVMRDALSHAIDREAILRASYSGYGAVNLSPLSRGIPGYDAAVAEAHGTPYDPGKARALLDQAGWTVGPGGLRAKDGKEAKFAIRSYANPVTDRALAVIQSNLAALGIQVSISTADWGTFYPSLLRDGWDLALNRWTYSDPLVLTNLFRPPGHRRNLPPDEALTRLLTAVDSTLDPAERQKVVSEAQKAILDRRLMIPILTNHQVTITQAGLQNYRFDYLNQVLNGDVRMSDW